ncbi:MAG TPA: acyl-CoA dehydratase activase-related protein [Smithella sp.]|nr:acyl-CoA dehydratase activase-related protein [Smithella sp.]
MDRAIRVGVDVGSTTIKMVVIDEFDHIVFHRYLRHFSNIVSTLRGIIDAAHAIWPKKPAVVMFTGSAGIGVSECLEVSFVQEVVACTQAVKRIIPDTDVVIELGGEDAKITYFDGVMEQRMNGICAGGTGAFIDSMAALLNTDPAGLNELAKHYKTIYPIASRCGVFAKTDVQALMNEGTSKNDIAVSVLQAVVNQTISGLAQGRPIKGKVTFLGGPLCFLSELRKRFIETLGLKDDQIINPENSQYFVAIGAALSPQENPVSFELLYKRVPRIYSMRAAAVGDDIAPLFANEKEYQLFKSRHARHAVPRQDMAEYTGKAFLGIDAGSTTTKLALVSESGSLLYSSYGGNQGRPLETVIAALRKLYAILPPGIHIAGSTVTGYGEQLIKAALRVDAGEVETVAHLKAANCFLPGVSFVLDIGGQDMKSFFVRDGAVDSIMLNEACSSGCGSFIETYAQSLGLSAHDFSILALQAPRPVDLGTRCTVFINSKVRQAQKEGAGVGDISAGLALSVIKNALFKVIRLKNTAELGEKIVVQGGTFYNDAVLRAMEKIIGSEVVRPDIAGIMGAYGSGLLALEHCRDQKKSTLLTADELTNFTCKTDIHRCGLCGNQCLITAKKFMNGQQYYSGNRCERGAGQEKRDRGVPNLFEFKYKRLFRYVPLDETARRGTIGIPRALNMYEDYPFWFTFFTELGYRVVLSGRSSPKLYKMGMETIPSETLCYSAKLMHGHIADLVDKGVKKIFYPCIPRNIREDSLADDYYNCPVVTSYPENIAANMDILRNGEILFLHPFLPLDRPDRMAQRLVRELACENLPNHEIRDALDKAYIELAAYKADVRQKGEDALVYMKQHNMKGIVLTGRPYHIDPEIHHGLPELIQSYGLAILSEDSVRHLADANRPLRVVDQWMYHSRAYAAASFVAQRTDIELIQLNSFGCGLDAVVMDQVKEILDAQQKIYTVIKLDEISNLGAARIRVRSLLAALREKEQNDKAVHILPEKYSKAVFTSEMERNHTILVPQMSPIHFQFLQTSLQKAGYRAVIPAVPDRMAIEEGLKYLHNDICYPCILVAGQMLSALKSGEFDLDHTSIMLSQTGGGCRASNYVSLMRKALYEAGMPQIPVLSLRGEKSPGFSLTLSLVNNLITSILYGDLLMRVLYRTRPYEKIRGTADQLYDHWVQRCQKSLISGGKWDFRKNVYDIVRDFDRLEIDEKMVKPKVGIVGEILVKFHPGANNGIVKLLETEGAEVVMPDLMNFFLYSAYDPIVDYNLLSGTFGNWALGELSIKILEFFRRDMKKALAASNRFDAPHSIDAIAAMAENHLSLGNTTGEGWLLTGEMVTLIRSGVNNILCLQPFGCLPNHITGKGMIKDLVKHYPEATIVPLDYDPGASEVNQLNRIKLMLSIAKEKNREYFDNTRPAVENRRINN